MSNLKIFVFFSFDHQSILILFIAYNRYPKCYFFSSLALASGILVIRARNPVHSVLFLILVFCQAAGLLLLQNLDFFAMIFLVVYVGAIAVLFLFVVMMLNIKLAEISERKLRYVPIGGFLGLLFLGEMILIVNNDLIPWLGSPEMWTPLAQTSPGPWVSWAQLLEAVQIYKKMVRQLCKRESK